MTKPNQIISVILAAGEAKRMGKTKQLLQWGKHTLIEHAIEQHLKSKVSEVYVVLGADAENIKNTIEKLPIQLLENPDWQLGLGSSIATVVKHLINKNRQADGLLIALADQPLLDAKYLNLLIQTFQENPQKIVATTYEKKSGVPALFPIAYLDALSKLTGDRGASAFINTDKKKLLLLNPENKIFDIDTVEDYNRLHKVYFKDA